MTELEHFEDNLNSNLTNELALTRFIEVAKKVRANLNDKWGSAFIDPGSYWDFLFLDTILSICFFKHYMPFSLIYIKIGWFNVSKLFKLKYIIKIKVFINMGFGVWGLGFGVWGLGFGT